MSRKRGLSGLALLLLLWMSIPLSVSLTNNDHRDYPFDRNDVELQNALAYLRTLQNDDGGFSNPGEESAVSNTQWAVMALVAAGEDPHAWKKSGYSPIEYLRANADRLLGSTDYERMILALVAAGENPRDFAGHDFVAELKTRYLKEDGQFSDFIYTTIWGILALSAVGEDVSASVAWLKAHQNEDGGFAWAWGEKSDYDDTAAAIMALIAAGERADSTVIQKALEYLKTGQNEDGGFTYFGSSPSNAASDAWCIQAIVACREDPRGWTRNRNNPVEHLLSLQQPDGSFYYTSYVQSNPGYMTVCAIIALCGKPFPIKGKLTVEETPMPTTTLIPSPTPSTTSPTPPQIQPTAPSASPSPSLTPSTATTPSAQEEEPRTAIPSFACGSAILALVSIALMRRIKNSRLR